MMKRSFQADGLRILTLGLCIGVPLVFGLAAALMPQDNNWDLRNYHWYNAYAFLTGRMGFDLAPAQTPTYYNPLLDVPFYLLAQMLPARMVAFLLGVIQGCNFVLLFALARRALVFPGPRQAVLAPAAIALVGMVGAGHLGMLGATFYDNILSLFFLGALVMILRKRDLLLSGPMPAALKHVAVAGAVVGLAVGLKLPAQVFAVGVCFGLLLVPGPFLRRFWLSFVCGLGVIAGFILTGGWWIAKMWRDYQNPLFPYMNDVFRSPWALAENYRDTRFLPASLGDALLFPFRFVADSTIASEISFVDTRVAVAFAVLAVTAVIVLARRRASRPPVDMFAARYLFAAAGLTYVSWLAVFAIYRYITALEMLAPLLIVMGIALWPLTSRLRAGLAVALLLFVTLAIRTEDWTRLPWAPGLGGSFVDVKPPAFADPGNTLILMAGLAPTSYAIPAFPAEIAFLRPVSYLAGPDHDTRFIQTIKDRLAAHTGEIYLLQLEWEVETANEILPRLGLAPDLAKCRPVANNLDPALELCPVRRRP